MASDSRSDHAAGAGPAGRAPALRPAVPAPLARDYDVAVEPLLIAGRPVSLLAVRDPNRLLEAVDPASFAVDERLPYWAELWTSAIALAEWCLTEPPAPGTAALELGCGLGLAGIAAVLAGARVTMTDYDDEALRFARANAGRNLPGPLRRSALEIRPLDWRMPVLDRRYELILGADIVYERRMFEPLLALFHQALAPGGIVVLTEPDRSVGAAFFQLAEERGFTARTAPMRVHHRGRVSTVLRVTLRPGAP